MTTTHRRAARAIRADARVPAVLGALTISLSGPLVALAGTSPATATFYRCLLALPFLGLLLVLRPGWRWPGRRSLLAGVFLGVDMLLWSESILSVGAGVSTVLVNVQVVVVPLLCLLLFSERIPARFGVAAPVLLAGVALAGGIADAGADGSDPVRGTVTGVLAGVAYAGYLVLLRRTGSPSSNDRVAGLAGVNVAAGGTALVTGLVTGTLDLAPPPAAFGWLLALALTGQIVGWLLIGAALSRLTASTGATILLLQPVGALVVGVLALGERPSPLQLAGCAVVVLAVGVVARSPIRSAAATGPPDDGSRPGQGSGGSPNSRP